LFATIISEKNPTGKTMAAVAAPLQPIPIDLRNYRPPGAAANAAAPPPLNGLQTQHFETRLIQDITNHYAVAADRLNAFAYCLAQVWSAREETFSGFVASALETHFMALARSHPRVTAEAQRVLRQGHFKHTPNQKMKDLIKKVDYYNLNPVSKFIHHLQGGLEWEKAMSGTTLFIGGTVAFLGGATLYLISDQDEMTKKIGLTSMVAGVLMAGRRFISAAQKLRQDEP
jgi:hypothetical protein